MIAYNNCIRVIRETSQNSSRVLDHYFKIHSNVIEIDEITYDFAVLTLLNEVRYKIWMSKWPPQTRFTFGRMNLRCIPTETEGK